MPAQLSWGSDLLRAPVPLHEHMVKNFSRAEAHLDGTTWSKKTRRRDDDGGDGDCDNRVDGDDDDDDDDASPSSSPSPS